MRNFKTKRMLVNFKSNYKLIIPAIIIVFVLIAFWQLYKKFLKPSDTIKAGKKIEDSSSDDVKKLEEKKLIDNINTSNAVISDIQATLEVSKLLEAMGTAYDGTDEDTIKSIVSKYNGSDLDKIYQKFSLRYYIAPFFQSEYMNLARWLKAELTSSEYEDLAKIWNSKSNLIKI